MQKSIFKDYLALIKVGIVYSNLFTSFTGTWLALYFTGQGIIDNLGTIFLSLLGTGMIIAGACGLNNYIDRDIDHLMSRTKERPTITGTISLRTVLLLGFCFILIGLSALAYLSLAAAVVGLIGVFIYVGVYSLWAKRTTVYNTIIGSFAGAVPPIIGWLCVDQTLHPVAIGIFLLMFIWQPPHFYSLAIRRCEEYRAAGIPMMPVVKGFDQTKLRIIGWILLLFPVLFLLRDLGVYLIVVLALLSLGWLYITLIGFRQADTGRWASRNFFYSLNFLVFSFSAMIVVTLIDRLLS